MPTPRRYDAWRVTAVCIFALSVAARQFSSFDVDPDLWGHLEFGRSHWESGALQRTDPYSYTAPGAAWINHEWLAELGLYAVYREGGDRGLLLFRLALGLLTVWCVYATCRIRDPTPFSLLVALVLCVFVQSRGYKVRPQIFSFLLFGLELFLLHLFLLRNVRCLWLLPPLMALWCNLHGGFVLGLGILLGVTGWVWLSGLWSDSEPRRRRQLALCSLVSVAAVLFNPYGLDLLRFLYRSLSRYQSVSDPRPISEWAPIDLLSTSFPDVKLLALLALLTALLRRAKCRGWEVLALVALFIEAARHQRNAVFFGIAAAPFVAENLSQLQERIIARRADSRFRPLVTAVFVVLLLAGSAREIADVRAGYSSVGWRILIDPAKYPVDAIGYVTSHHLQGNLFVFFDWGEYAIWKLYPDCKVSIDGRLDTVYPEAIISGHLFRARTTEGLAELLERYQADILLWPSLPTTQALAETTEAWVLAYSDPTAVVFVRRGSPNDKRVGGEATVSNDAERLRRRYFFPG